MKTSIFENDEFTRGFIEFYGSQDFERYMVPFFKEMIEVHRDKLETTKDAPEWQAKLKAIRFIMDQADIQKFNRADRLTQAASDK